MKPLSEAMASLPHIVEVPRWLEARLNRIYRELGEARSDAARERLLVELSRERSKIGKF